MRFSSITAGLTLIAPAASMLDMPSAIACSVFATARSAVVLRLLLELESFPAGCNTAGEDAAGEDTAGAVVCSGVFAGGGDGVPSSTDCTTDGWFRSNC